MKSDRLDKLLVQQGLALSRTQAQRLIAAGAVKGRLQGVWSVLDKPAQKFMADLHLEVDSIDELQFVSRAGLKLDRALNYLGQQTFVTELKDKTFLNDRVLDIGQSTGGFTDCALRRGACIVVGVDVGIGQLAESLRGDPRVRCIEKANARELVQILNEHQESTDFDWVLMDVSFISQTLILPAVAQLAHPGTKLLSLVKPQFEVGPEGIGKGGLVKNSNLFVEVERKIKAVLAELNFNCLAFFDSELPGTDGNREFFVFAERQENP